VRRGRRRRVRYGFAAGEALFREEIFLRNTVVIVKLQTIHAARVCSISYYYLFVSVYALLARYNSS